MSSLSINMLWLNGGGYANDGAAHSQLLFKPIFTFHSIQSFTVTKAVLIIDQLA